MIALARHGVEDMSLRAIMREAGANPAAVHYHYGSRQELARAVLDRVLEPLQARRLELLDALLSPDAARKRSGPPTVEDLVAALVRPDLEAMVEVGGRNPHGARIVGTIYTRPSAFVTTLVEESFAPVATRFAPHFAAALPDLDPTELSWRIRWGVFGIVGALLSDDASSVTSTTIEAELARVLSMTVGGLSAPPTKEYES